MSLSEIIESVQGRASLLCEQCLGYEIADEVVGFGELVARLADAEKNRGTSPEADALYCEVLGEVIAAMAVITVFTVELTKCPPGTAYVISLN